MKWRLSLLVIALLCGSCEDIRKAKQDCLTDPKCNADFHFPPEGADGGSPEDAGVDAGVDAGSTTGVLTVTVRGEGAVNVDASAQCTEATSPCVVPFQLGAHVTLNAAPSDAAVFHRWWRSCSSADTSATCDLTVNGATTEVLITFWRYNYAFVTSATQAAGSLQSLAAADAICQSSAVQAELPGRYLAFLSSTTEDVANRFADAGAAGWVRPDGKLFALDRASMFRNGQNTIFYPLDLDERGQSVSGHAATGSDTAGRVSTPEGLHFFTCSDFTTTVSDAGVTVGRIGGGGRDFIDDENHDPRFEPVLCSDPVHLYCFGVDSNALPPRPSIPPDAGRIFLSAPVPGNVGLAFFDTLCDQEGDGGRFSAFIASTTQSAMQRLPGPIKFPLYRLDGVLVAPELVTDGGLFRVATDVDWTGEHSDKGFAWLGGNDPFTAAAPNESCDNWVDGGGVAQSVWVRLPPPENSEPQGSGNRDCTKLGNVQPVYCVEY